MRYNHGCNEETSGHDAWSWLPSKHVRANQHKTAWHELWAQLCTSTPGMSDKYKSPTNIFCTQTNPIPAQNSWPEFHISVSWGLTWCWEHAIARFVLPGRCCKFNGHERPNQKTQKISSKNEILAWARILPIPAQSKLSGDLALRHPVTSRHIREWQETWAQRVESCALCPAAARKERRSTVTAQTHNPKRRWKKFEPGFGQSYPFKKTTVMIHTKYLEGEVKDCYSLKSVSWSVHKQCI